jgi:hypothetical protein
VANIPDTDGSDSYKLDGLGKPLSFSGVDVYVDSGRKNANSAYFIDVLKPVAAHVKPRVLNKSLGFYVDLFRIDRSQFVLEMLEVRGDRLFGGEGSCTLAGAVFNIEGCGSARWHKKLAFHIRRQLQNPRKQLQLKKKKVAYGLIRDTKGYHIHFSSSSNFPIEKVMTIVRLGETSEWHGVSV